MSPENISKAIQDKLDDWERDLSKTQDRLVQGIEEGHPFCIIIPLFESLKELRGKIALLKSEKASIRSKFDVGDRVDILEHFGGDSPSYVRNAVRDTSTFLSTLIA